MQRPSSGALRRDRLTAALVAALLLPAAGAQAQAQSSSGASDESARTLDRVTVTGSRIKRTEIEGPAPIVVISRADMDSEGFQTVGDMLQSLSQNTTSSFTGDLAVTGFTPNAQVVNLRNLGPGYTLTLINGRRPAMYPQPYNRDNNVVNVRAIPTAAVERVEILTGGASAIYGSDAVAGVVNIVLRENFDGNTFTGTAGVTEDGGGNAVDLQYVGGTTGDRWNAVYALQYSARDPVFGSQRDWLADTRNGPLGPDFTNPALSLVAIRASASPNGPTNHNAYYPGEAACRALGFTTVTTAARGTYCGSYTSSASRSISNKYDALTGYGYGTFDVSDTLQLFASATFFDSESKSSGGTEFWGTSGNRFTPAGVYFDEQMGHLVQLQRVFTPEELGGPEAASTLYDERTFDVTVGASGVIANRFDWDASVMHSKYEYTADRPRLLAQGVHEYFLGPQLGTVSGYPVHELNLDRWSSPLTPDIYRSFSTRVINRGESSSSQANFTVSGDLFELPAGAVGMAGVLEWARQTSELRSDPRTDPLRPLDNQTIYNLTSSGQTDGERDRYAAGIEFRVPIFQPLTATLAARYDKYDDITQVDDAMSYMAALEYRPFDNLLLRTSYSTSFRAPDMQMVYAEGAASYSSILDEYSCRAGVGPGSENGPRSRTECNVSQDPTIYQTQTTVAGNAMLKEEEGTSWVAGFVWDIVDDMSLSVDYWRIKLEDAASQLSSSYLLENEANCRLGTTRDGSPYPNASDSAFCQNIYGLVTRTVAPGTNLDGRVARINSAYVNTALRDTSGIDATYKYLLDTDRMGRFRLDLAYTLSLTNKYKQFEDAELIDYRDRLDFPLAYTERSRVRGSIGWHINDWTTTLFGTRYGSAGSYASAEGVNAAGTAYGERLRPYILYNLTVAKRISESVRVQFDVINLTDNQYREDPSHTGYPFFNPYIGADPLGRRYNFNVEYKF